METNQNTQEVRNEHFLIWIRQNNVPIKCVNWSILNQKGYFLSSCVFCLIIIVVLTLRVACSLSCDALFQSVLPPVCGGAGRQRCAPEGLGLTRVSMRCTPVFSHFRYTLIWHQ